MRSKIFFLCFAFLIISGCTGKSSDKQVSHRTMEARLEKRGVTVAVIGDQILIVMPSALIFKPYTSTIMNNARPTLAMMANYINSYPNMLVDVSVYTGMTGTGLSDLELAKQQAKRLEKTLLIEGLDTRILHAAGKGPTQLVNKNKQEWQFNMNYRVEITLEKLVV